MSDFGHDLLAAIRSKAEENNRRDVVLMSQLESVVKRALGIPEEKFSPPVFFQQPVRGEFPHYRMRIDPNPPHAILEQRLVNNMNELGALLRENPSFSYVGHDNPDCKKEG